MKMKGQQVILCEHHINNLQDNNPCESCPVRKDPKKYKRVTLLDEALRDLGILIFTAISVTVIMVLSLGNCNGNCEVEIIQCEEEICNIKK